MSDVVIRCSTKALHEEVQMKAFEEGYTWPTGGNKVQYYWSPSNDCLFLRKEYMDVSHGSTKGKTISAEEYLNDRKIKAGDTVECISPKGASNIYKLEADRMYKVSRVTEGGAVYLIGESEGYCSNRFRKVVGKRYGPIAPAIVPFASVTQDEIQEKVCEFCRDHYEMSPSYLCEGVKCEEALDMYLEDNNLKLKEVGDMKDLNVSKNVMAVFGDKSAREVEVINRHFDVELLQRIVMKKHSKEIQAACIEAQEELDAQKTEG